jgi:hypothetical protein
MPERWTQREDIGPPPQGPLGGMAYDSDRSVTVLLDYVQSPTKPPAQTWEWDGSSWVQVDDMGPQAGYLVYVPDQHACLAYTNLDGARTWQRKDGIWTQLADTGPAKVEGLVYDTSRSRAVAVALKPSAAIETWEWDGQAWTVVAETGPLISQGSTVAYDATNKVTVLFGGVPLNATAPTSDTWLWDGVRWKHASNMGPPGRTYAGLTYDDNNKRALLFGGASGTGQWADTWAWDGKLWRQVSDMGPTARYFPGMSYDGKRDRTVLFGGYAEISKTFLADTWEYFDHS